MFGAAVSIRPMSIAPLGRPLLSVDPQIDSIDSPRSTRVDGLTPPGEAAGEASRSARARRADKQHAARHHLVD
jgi:hypothetical protein